MSQRQHSGTAVQWDSGACSEHSRARVWLTAALGTARTEGSQPLRSAPVKRSACWPPPHFTPELRPKPLNDRRDSEELKRTCRVSFPGMATFAAAAQCSNVRANLSDPIPSLKVPLKLDLAAIGQLSQVR